MTKVCTLCRIEKPVSDFGPRLNRKCPLRSECRACHARKSLAGYHKNPVHRRVTMRLWNAKNQRTIKEYNRTYRQKMTPERLSEFKADARKYRNENPKRMRGYALKKYGLTFETFERMAQAQDHKCAICKRRPPKLQVDHDHATGRVRELLCGHCNTGFGLFQESRETLLAAVAYHDKHLCES